ncbi:MAG: 2-hydroxyacyl-CoA dehydratase family protein [Planctomycetaceae bacterium]|nr:2-hydroxyacyl-CoA dehydratase family protein [Planctomycetaceae bacterium]
MNSKNTVIYCDPYIPPEWIAAHGLQPLRITPRISKNAAIGICPYARAFINEIKIQKNACAAILTTTCDQMRRTADVATQNHNLPIFLMNVPTIWQRKSAAELYAAELKRLGRFLTQFNGQGPTNAKLVETMVEFENKRNKASVQTKPNGKTPLALIGSHLLKQDNIIFDIVRKYGGYITLDATTDGPRTLPRKFNPAHLNENPIKELAAAYFETIPDVFQRPNDKLYEWFKKKLNETPVRGIIFHHYMWCDKWHAELGRISDKKFTNLPVLDISAGDNDKNIENRLATRIQAFMEMLE